MQIFTSLLENRVSNLKCRKRGNTMYFQRYIGTLHQFKILYRLVIKSFIMFYFKLKYQIYLRFIIQFHYIKQGKLASYRYQNFNYSCSKFENYVFLNIIIFLKNKRINKYLEFIL